MKRKTTVRAIACGLALTLALGVGYAKEKSRGEQDYDRVVEAGKFFFTHYLDAKPTTDPVKDWLITMFERDPALADQFINTMYQTWDPYAYYLNNETYSEAFDLSPSRVGVGITLEETSAGTVTITSVTVGSPAETAGLKAGDVIRAVNGKSVTGYTPKMVGDLLRGEIGETTSVRVLRAGREQTISVKHAALPVSTVSARSHGRQVCYIRVSTFNGTDTFMDFTNAYESLTGDGHSTVIVDLRDNPGGTLSCVTNILNYIIPEKGVPYLRQRFASPAQTKTRTSDGLGWVDNKLLILTNENTASSAEIFAGVLQDLGYAEVVGTKTYGKGFAQQHLPIDQDHTAVISYAEILLPVRGSYDGEGIIPDHEVSLYTTKYKMPKLSPLDLNSGVYATGKNVRAVEERLSELGYFYFTPDDTADFRTWHAVTQFQIAQELTPTDGFCDAKTVAAIDSAMKTLAETPVVYDTQFQKALMLARAYAARGNPATPIDAAKITFGAK